MFRDFSTWVIVLAIFLGGCAPMSDATPKPAPLTFLISGDPADETAYRTLVAAFMAANPDVAVELLNIPSGGDFRRRLAADFAARTPPDVFLINYRHLGPFVAGAAIAPVGPRLAQSQVISRDDFYAPARDAFTWQGVLQCLPQNMSSPVIYFNRDLFAAAGLPDPADGWTWAEFVAAARMLTHDQDGDGVVDQYGLGVTPSLVRAAPFVWMNGGELVDDPRAPTRLTLDSPATRAALAWFVALQTEHHVTPDAVAEAAESSLSRFLNGRLAMIVESRRATPEFRRIEAFDWDVAPLPAGKQPASLLHSDAYCLAAASSRQELAWRFVEFANTREGQRILAQSGRTVPSRLDLAESPVFLDSGAKPVHSRVFVDAIPTLRSFPLLPTWSDIEGVVDAELAQAFYGQLSLDAAIHNAEARSKEFFR
jgi:multiple sugar transport system substrate-binding protein